MRMLLVSILIVGFALLDVVVLIALFNMLGWTSVEVDTLFWMLLSAIAAMAGGIVGLRWRARASFKGE